MNKRMVRVIGYGCHQRAWNDGGECPQQWDIQKQNDIDSDLCIIISPEGQGSRCVVSHDHWCLGSHEECSNAVVLLDWYAPLRCNMCFGMTSGGEGSRVPGQPWLRLMQALYIA